MCHARFTFEASSGSVNHHLLFFFVSAHAQQGFSKPGAKTAAVKGSQGKSREGLCWGKGSQGKSEGSPRLQRSRALATPVPQYWTAARWPCRAGRSTRRVVRPLSCGAAGRRSRRCRSHWREDQRAWNSLRGLSLEHDDDDDDGARWNLLCLCYLCVYVSLLF